MNELPVRHVARLIVLDTVNSVLLVRYRDHRCDDPAFYWATPGGAVETGESYAEAAARELEEETHLDAQVGTELWRETFEWESPRGRVEQTERFFLAQVDSVAPTARNTSAEPIEEHRWWSITELESSEEAVYPEGLVDRLIQLLRLGKFGISG